MSMNTFKIAIETFEEKFGRDHGSVNDAIVGRLNIIAMVFDWDEWKEQDDLKFDIDSFSENPTMVTGRMFGGNNPTKHYLFSSGGNRSYFKAEYIDEMSDVLGYNIKSNLDKVYMEDREDSLLIAKGSEFDIAIAPRLPPSQQ